MSSEDRKLRTLWAQMDILRRELGDKVPSQTIAALLYIAMEPGITVLALGEKLRLSTSSPSRIAEALALEEKLVEFREVPDDRRAKALHLTSRGEKLVQSLFDV